MNLRDRIYLSETIGKREISPYQFENESPYVAMTIQLLSRKPNRPRDIMTQIFETWIEAFLVWYYFLAEPFPFFVLKCPIDQHSMPTGIE